MPDAASARSHPAPSKSRARDHSDSHAHSHGGMYWRLLAMAVLSFIAMYLAMYAMVDEFSQFLNNANQAYMAALMAAPMVMIELILMRAMYRHAALNVAILIVSALVLAASLWAIRSQAGIGDVQFLRSMIPHHSGAVLMCREAPVTDPRIRTLCETIIRSQRDEIAQMQAILASPAGR